MGMIDAMLRTVLSLVGVGLGAYGAVRITKRITEGTQRPVVERSTYLRCIGIGVVGYTLGLTAFIFTGYLTFLGLGDLVLGYAVLKCSRLQGRLGM